MTKWCFTSIFFPSLPFSVWCCYQVNNSFKCEIEILCKETYLNQQPICLIHSQFLSKFPNILQAQIYLWQTSSGQYINHSVQHCYQNSLKFYVHFSFVCFSWVDTNSLYVQICIRIRSHYYFWSNSLLTGTIVYYSEKSGFNWNYPEFW